MASSHPPLSITPAGWSALAAALLEETPLSDAEAAGGGAVFGDYHLEEEIARGGMGIVYRAWQVSLARPVAVKVMREGAFADGREVERFSQEAAAAGALRHPGIVPVYESGVRDGRRFHAMEWIAGPNLAEATRAKPATARQAAQWAREVAEAIAHAHAQGVVHRDLKPANVLLDPEGRTRVTDFGIARRSDTAAGLTLSGQMLGTPGYMAPEVAAGKARAAGAAVDVYGLGALLYHLLTGRAPFIGESHATVLRQVVEEDPVSPRLLNGSVPRDLETICLKALQRDPTRRFASASEMAADLRRFLHGEPIRARPVSAAGRFWRWCRRKPALAASMAGVLLLGAGIIATTLWSRQRIESMRREAVERLYASDMRLALQNIAEGKYGAAAALVERHAAADDGRDLRGFEWRLARETCRSGELAALESMQGVVRRVAISPDGRWLAAAADNLRLWELRGEMPVLHATLPDQTRSLAFSPDSRRLAVALQDGSVRVLPVATPAAPLHEASLPESALALAWRADGSTLEMIAGAKHWRWLTGKGRPAVAAELRGAARSAVFSADGSRAAFLNIVVGELTNITVWDAAAGREVHTRPLPERSLLSSFDLSPDGRRLFAGDYSGRVMLFEEPFTSELWSMAPHRAMVDACAFPPRGPLLLMASGQSLLLFDSASHKEAGWLRGHRGKITSAAFSPDARSILTGDSAGAVKWWRTPGSAGPEDLPALVHMSAYADMLAWERPTEYGWEWRVLPWGGVPFVLATGEATSLVVLTRQAGWFYIPGKNADTVRRLTFDGTSEVLTLPGTLFTVSPDDRWIVCAMPGTGRSILHDRSGAVPDRPLGDESRPAYPAFTPDGTRCALGFRTGEVRVLETATGRELCRFQAHRYWAYGRAWSRDGRLLATAGFDGRACLWDIPSGRLVREFPSSEDSLWSAALSPDGSRLAAGTSQSSVILWDTASGLQTATIALGPPQQTVEMLSFTPDGKALCAHRRLLRAP